MYTLLIVIMVLNAGETAALKTQQIDYSSIELCQDAAKQTSRDIAVDTKDIKVGRAQIIVRVSCSKTR